MSETRELRKLARGGLGGLVGAVVSSASGFVFLAVAAQAFSQSQVGLFFALSSVFLVALALIELGSDVGLVRFVATHLAGGHRREAVSTIVVVLVPTFLLALVTALVLTLFSTALTGLLGGDTVTSGSHMLVVLLAFLPLAAMSDLLLATTRGLGTVKPTIVADNIVRQGLQPVLVGVAALLLPGRPTMLALAWALPYVASLAIALWSVRGELRKHGVGATHFRLDRAVLRGTAAGVWRFNSSRSVAQIAQMAIRRMDIPLVSAIAGPSSAAVYTAASRFVAVGQLGIKGVQQMVGPQIARLLGEDRRPDAGMVLRTATSWSVVMAWPVYLTFAVLADLLLSLFGPEYSRGATAVVILSMAMLVGTIAGPVDIALLMSGRSVQSLMNNLSALVVNLGLNFLLIPRLGVEGAALAWAAAIVISNGLPTLQIRTAIGSPANDRRAVLAAGLAVLCFGLLPAAAWWAGADSAWRVAAVVLGGVLYLGLLWRFRLALHLVDLVTSVRPHRRTGPLRQA